MVYDQPQGSWRSQKEQSQQNEIHPTKDPYRKRLKGSSLSRVRRVLYENGSKDPKIARCAWRPGILCSHTNVDLRPRSNRLTSVRNDGPAKQAIVSFVSRVTNASGADYVDPRMDCDFDQDGTLWVEHPLYAQAMFALARVHELAPQHSEWKQSEPFKAVLANDREAMGRLLGVRLGRLSLPLPTAA